MSRDDTINRIAEIDRYINDLEAVDVPVGEINLEACKAKLLTWLRAEKGKTVSEEDPTALLARLQAIQNDQAQQRATLSVIADGVNMWKEKNKRREDGERARDEVARLQRATASAMNRVTFIDQAENDADAALRSIMNAAQQQFNLP